MKYKVIRIIIGTLLPSLIVGLVFSLSFVEQGLQEFLEGFLFVFIMALILSGIQSLVAMLVVEFYIFRVTDKLGVWLLSGALLGLLSGAVFIFDSRIFLTMIIIGSVVGFVTMLPISWLKIKQDRWASENDVS